MRLSTVVGGLVATVIAVESASGAFITLGDSGWKAYFGDGVNVELVGVAADRSNVTIEQTAQFADPFDRGVGPTLEITFVQVSANAVPRITVKTDSITNDTGTDWGALTFSLTETTGGDPGVVRFDPDTTLATDQPRLDPFNAFAFSADDTALQLHGGILPKTESWLGSDDAKLVILAAPAPSGIGTMFSLSIQPTDAADPSLTIPEPAGATVLLLLGVAGLSRRSRRR